MPPFPIPSTFPFRIIDGPPRRVETEEVESGIDLAFYESVILLILT
jgi:hypothetical protein